MPYIHIWFGANNSQFASELAEKITKQVQTLVDAGANHIFVPSIYPRHLAPVNRWYFTNDTDDIAAYGVTIQQANTELASNLKQFGDKVIYYDAFKIMNDIWNVPEAYGFTHTEVFEDWCDGCPNQAEPGISNWDLCQVEMQANTFYWMQFIDPTTHVHQLVAQDMATSIKAAFGA